MSDCLKTKREVEKLWRNRAEDTDTVEINGITYQIHGDSLNFMCDLVDAEVHHNNDGSLVHRDLAVLLSGANLVAGQNTSRTDYDAGGNDTRTNCLVPFSIFHDVHCFSRILLIHPYSSYMLLNVSSHCNQLVELPSLNKRVTRLTSSTQSSI